MKKITLPTFLTQPDPLVLLTDNYIVVDYETTNLDKGNPRRRNNRLVYAGWTVGPSHPRFQEWGDTVRGHFGNEFDQRELVQAIREADVFVAQNTKFELGWGTRLGIPLETVLPYDTILGEYMIDGNRKRRRDLDSLARRYKVPTKESVVSRMIKGGVCPSEIPASWLAKYCKQDVRITKQIFLKQREKLRIEGLLPVTYTANLFTPVLTDIELNGMFLDADRVREFHAEYSRKLADVNNTLASEYGEINFDSPTQVARLVYTDLGFSELKDNSGHPIRNKPTKQFPDGLPKVDAGTLAGLVATNKKQERFITLFAKHSKLQKSVSTYLNKFLDAVENHDCHLYGKFNQAVTGTHRLSSSGPNFQNFDRHFKVLFTPRDPDAVIGERDEAQLEFRAAAFLGNDAQARKDISENFDVHSFTASVIFSDHWVDKKTTPQYRQDSKPHTFKPLYGGISGTPEERAYYQAFREKYSDCTATQDGWVDKALSDGTQTVCTGMKFYHRVKMTRSGYVEGNTNVRNYPIQYLATGEIVPIGATHTWHKMKALGLRSLLVNTVHDSIITEEYPDETPILTEIAEESFSTDVVQYMETVYGFTFDVPLELETELGSHWGEH